jgi:hypothetical protein
MKLSQSNVMICGRPCKIANTSGARPVSLDLLNVIRAIRDPLRQANASSGIERPLSGMKS